MPRAACLTPIHSPDGGACLGSDCVAPRDIRITLLATAINSPPLRLHPHPPMGGVSCVLQPNSLICEADGGRARLPPLDWGCQLCCQTLVSS